jgi:ankyrin repeat protein
MQASKLGDAESVETLLKKGANPNYRDKDGLTPLHLAALGGHADVAELLIKHGADVNARGKDGSTPLHLAAHEGQVKVAELLIRHGAEVNAKSYYGRTPLHLAAQEGHADVAELLIRHGADLNAKNSENKTPLDVARERGQGDVARVIEEFTRMPSELFDAVKRGDTARVKELIEKGVDVNARDKDDWAPLDIAAYNGYASVAELLIKNGADVNARDNKGFTPLHFAAYNGHVDVAELLLKHGADLNAKNNDGWTPLHYAAQEGHADVAELLIRHGADLNAKNSENKTPLDVARERGQGDVARVIEEFIASRLAILGVEAPELHAGEWGKVIVRARGVGEARISIEGDVGFEAPSSYDLRGEKSVELLVKPSASGQVPVKISLETLGITVAKAFTLQVKSRVELVARFLVGRRVELGQLEGDFREKLRPLRKPFRLGRLKCRSLLGQGGFATVVVCVDEFGVSYAVKMPTQVYTELTSVRGGAPTQVNVDLKPFLREVEALRSVSGHPCIVGFHGFIDSPPALVFELCKCSLRDVLRHGGLGPVRAAEVLVQIADALAFLHSKGYVHGDVKPDNILFSFEGVPKLSDFNTAKALATVSKTRPGYTPGYAAPEQWGMEEKVIEKADSWALGLVLYEAVTGKPLLPLDKLGYREAVARLGREKLAFESTGVREIDELVESCLKVSPEDRPTATQIRDTLAKYLATQI